MRRRRTSISSAICLATFSVSVESFAPFSHVHQLRRERQTRQQLSRKLSSTEQLSRKLSSTHSDNNSETKSDEELLAERLASAPSAIDKPLPWLIQPNTSPMKEEKPWFTQFGAGNEDGGDVNLPFECTGCGKCCKTKGDVYLSPSETKGAAKLLSLPISDFKQAYVAEEEVTVLMSLDPEEIPPGETGWTVLRHKEEDGSCIFLNDEGLCNIYEARPLQCSTYPFWPRIMASRYSWNSEVRLEGDAPEVASTQEANKRLYWSVKDGGCEGMHEIKADGTCTSDIEGISSREAEERLKFYERYKLRFPNTELRPIIQNEK